MRFKVKYYYVISFFVFLSNQVRADVIKGSIAQMPVVSESREKGLFPDIVRAMAKVSGQKIDFDVAPFARSMAAVENGEVDFHLPLIEPPDMSKSKFSLSTGTVYQVNFVLYSNTLLWCLIKIKLVPLKVVRRNL